MSVDPATMAALIQAGGQLVDLFGGSGDDTILEAIRTGQRGEHAGAKAGRQALNDYYGRAMGLNQPGNDAYGSAMRTIDTLLNGGYVENPTAGGPAGQKWMAYIDRQKENIANAKREIARKASFRANADDNWQQGIDSANARTNAQIKEYERRIKDAQGKYKAAVKTSGGKTRLSVAEWMKQVDPGYQFRYDEGMRAVNARQSAGKDRLSGRALREAARYGQDYATGEFEKSINRLFKQAGLGDASVSRTTGATVAQGGLLSGNYANEAEDYANSLIAQGNIKSGSDARQSDAYGAAGGTLLDRYRRSMGGRP